MSRTDEELIVLSQHGDETAFAELMDRYQNKVYTLAVHLLADREEGRDVAQEVFIRVYHALPRFRKDADFLRWLYTITANIARDRWRRRKKEKGTIRVSLEEMAAGLPDYRFSPEPLLVKKDVRLIVEKAVTTLPWEYRMSLFADALLTGIQQKLLLLLSWGETFFMLIRLLPLTLGWLCW